MLSIVLRILHTPQIGTLKFWQLWDHFNSLEKIMEWLKQNSYSAPSEIWSKQHINSHTNKNIKIIHFLDPAFPNLLKHVSGCPPILYCRGDMTLIDKPMIGIVGARNASIPIIHLIKRLAQDLGRSGYIIVSGLAAGIDTAAHLGSLDTGTIGVCAGGIDQIYPQQNAQLYQSVGLLISEMPLGTKPIGYLFPKRNRIIAGLSAGIVVAEAGFQSGSLITGQYAVEFNREVFVIPGSPLDPRSRGGNKLIKEGAYLAENAEDILSILRSKNIRKTAHPTENQELLTAQSVNDEKSIDILSYLSFTPVSLDELQEQTKLPMDRIRKKLAQLEIRGKIISDPNGQVYLTGKKGH